MKRENPRREVQRIHELLKQAYEGPAWSGPSVQETLKGVTAARAAARPLEGAHSIWEITEHIAVWEEAVRRRLGGERWSPSRARNFPRITDKSPRAWRETRERLAAGHHALREAVLALTDEDLDRAPVEGGASAYRLAHGAAQHDLYHAGQIAILKKRKTARQAKPQARKPGKPRG